jgi:hypothetical protein
MDDGFDKIILTKREKDLIVQMDCNDITITKVESCQYNLLLKRILDGENVYYCQQNSQPVLCELKDIEPFYLDNITYNNDYIFYSYIVAYSSSDAFEIFQEKIKALGILENGEFTENIDIDDVILSHKNSLYLNSNIEITDKFPERTIRKREISDALLEIFKQM